MNAALKRFSVTEDNSDFVRGSPTPQKQLISGKTIFKNKLVKLATQKKNNIQYLVRQ